MPSNLLLLLPLLGGYIFIHLCYFTRFRAQALEGHRLIFESAVWGFLFVLPARLLTRYELARLGWVQDIWKDLAASRTEFLGTLICALALAPLLAVGCNFLVAAWLQAEADLEDPVTMREFLEPARLLALDRAIVRSGNDLHKLLHTAATGLPGEPLPLCLYMADRKIYVGLVLESPNLRPDEQYLSLIPLKSGYREKDDLHVVFSVSYPVEEYEKTLDPQEFTLLLPFSEIKSARLWNSDYDALLIRQAPSGPAQSAAH